MIGLLLGLANGNAQGGTLGEVEGNTLGYPEGVALGEVEGNILKATLMAAPYDSC